ncbi:MAG: helix-turn-helix domain-containing protein [Treponema sp.]|jgi:transcriptional regulator with XRE-family HTH domain|nr:helix-turn-helix domain-containing protein [Treponema sp.]
MEILFVFSENMKKYRKKANLTQEKLAELCNTDYRYIGQIETGRRCPSLEFIGRIAAALNIAPYLLFYDETGMGNEGLAVLHEEQKQKIKTMLIENISKICLIIDEQY